MWRILGGDWRTPGETAMLAKPDVRRKIGEYIDEMKSGGRTRACVDERIICKNVIYAE
jgi:hypothetical protein